MKRNHFFLALTICWAIFYASTGFSKTVSRNNLMDKTGWRTYCFGRYLVELPPEAKVRSAYKMWGIEIESVPAETPATLKARIDKREGELKASRHESGESMFVRRVDYGNGSVSLLSWNSPRRKILMSEESYFVATNPWRVFRYNGEISASRQDHAVSLIGALATNIRARSDKEIPSGPGFCIDEGFVAGGEYRTEEVQVGITFPQHPNALITIDASTGAEQDRLLERVDKFFATAVAGQLSGLKILRKRQRNVGPIEAEEYATAASGNGQRVYAFAWESQGKDKSLSEQNIVAALKVLEQSVITEHTPYRPAFKSDEEALQLWDAIIDSIRLRPGAV
ncbi:T6SS immunity protein Tli4 family protein (plasmid) [Ralstonia pseudosolanacearum]|nr:T6SS immunity protein Tli4 family protein [Ralstonia pseudosolanacearum]ASL76625.1 hypothetical protein BC350_24315 [Ralstonia pseudosolanacearum]OIT09477.1 hypothetical protein BL241_22305 [Ralstonia solanacearum]